MITLMSNAQFSDFLDLKKGCIVVRCTSNLGVSHTRIEIDAEKNVDASIDNLLKYARMLENRDDIIAAADDLESLEEMLEENIIAAAEDYLDLLTREDDETDAEYVLRLWSASDGHTSIRSCAEALGGDLTDKELGQPEWGVFELPDGSFVTESDSDENAWENADEIRKYLREVEFEDRRLEAESRWIEEAFE